MNNCIYLSDICTDFLYRYKRLQNNVIFLFCERCVASVTAITVSLRTYEDNWSYFCCLHLAARLYEKLSFWLLSERRGEERKREEKGGDERRGGAVNTEEISSEDSNTKKRAKLEMSERERGGGQSHSSYQNLLLWLFDLQLVRTTATVKAVDSYRLPFSTTGET